MAHAPSTTEGRVRTAPVESLLNLDVPSSKYKELPGPPETVLQQAAIEPKPLLPKFKPLRTWQATQREVIPLNSSLIGEPSSLCWHAMMLTPSSTFTHIQRQDSSARRV
jgi:hypothetical protein